ncbi:MAG TPA: hypothetical protein VN873_14425 [Candidatus Angelobacter sp.]|nr:hypothetical protein [Candidatus Angelobacter sp.]
MKSQFQKQIVFVLLAVIILSAGVIRADEPARLSISVLKPGAEISTNVLGLSYETSLMLPDTNGVHYFRPNNRPLVAIFKTLGVKSLRIGGNSVDAPNVPVPSEKDVMSFFEFARVAGVKVIYSVRLEEPKEGGVNTNSSPTPGSMANAQSAAQFAKLIHHHYAGVLDCFAIGNEPGYFRDYNVYSAKWKAIHDAIIAVWPDAQFCGPDQNPSPALDKKMVRDFANASGGLKMITQHSYPFGCSYRNPQARKDITKLVPFDASESREKMLSSEAYDTYDRIYKGIAGAIAGSSVSYRLTEANSFWFSGLKGASDSYASALWAVDYLYWWADHGAAGVNFHTGDRTGGDLAMICRYAAFVTSPHGYEVRPLGYGMKLFDFGGHGRQLPVAISSATNLVAYATSKDGSVAVTLINKAHGVAANNLDVQIKFDRPLIRTTAQVIFLKASNGDIAAGSSDITLGGASIKEDGTWRGHWTPLAISDDHTISVSMPRASAAVIRATLK